MTPQELSLYIKAEAKRLGFAVCGIAKAGVVPQEEVKRFTDWIEGGNHGTMSYLERNNDKRENPTLLVPGCKSIICVAMSYAQPATPTNRLHLSRYARGKDYHRVVKDRLHALLKSINEATGARGRAFCDSAPILEHYWAEQAGIGRVGLNHQLIIPGLGTFFFLGELFIDQEAEADTPIDHNLCINCNRCIINCPTGALTKTGFDARKCLSYLTIEHRGELPENIGKKMGNCFYGCDRCNASCPHNGNNEQETADELLPSAELSEMSDEEWFTLSEEKYNSLFKESAVERAGYAQLMRNINEIKKQR